jgi:hypothetical protein
MTDKPMMRCAEVDEALLEYLEESLDGVSRGRVDEHVAGCLRCSAIMRDIGAIRSEAARLPELAPSRELWPEIAARIEPAVVPLAVRPKRDVPRTWIPALAAAAAVLVVATAGITYLATSRSLVPSASRVAVSKRPAESAPRSTTTEGAPGSSEPTVAGVSPPPVETTGTAPEVQPAATLASRSSGAPASPSELAFGDEIARLQNIVTERRRRLDPATVLVIEQSLKIIDAAVKQSRAALARDPNSGFLADQLNHALDKKVELLRTVALLPSRT